MSSPDRHLVCPRCGADAQGAAWCPQCGRNLRITAEPKEPPTTESPTAVPPPESPPPREPPPARPPPPPPPPRDPGLPWKVVAAALVAVAVVAGIVVLALSGGGGGGGSSVASVTTEFVDTGGTTETTPQPTTGPTSTTSEPAAATSSGVSRAAMATLLVLYQRSYSAESVEGLRSLFTDDFQRADTGTGTEDLEQALATYQSQFDQLTSPQYQLSGVQFGDDFATAAYTITSAEGTSTGNIDFKFVATDQGPRIQSIAVTPS